MNHKIISAIILFTAAVCAAQPAEMLAPQVVHEGKATLFTPPTHMEVLIEKEISGEKLETAMDQALAFRDSLHAKLQECQLHPVEMTFLAPEITSLENRTVREAVMLRFSLTGYTAPDNGAIRFAALCDTLMDVGAALSCRVSEPRVIVKNEEELMRNTIEAAVAEAFPGADAVANVLNSTIYAVEKVEILEVSRDRVPDSERPQSALVQTACTARVRVTYIISPRS